MPFLLCLLAILILLAPRSGRQEEAPIELRGAWIATEDLARLATRQGIADAMRRLADSGLNAVLPPARSRTDPATRELLAEILFEAHRHGLEVVPWFDPGDASEDAAARIVIELCRGHDLDGVVLLGHFARIRHDVLAFDPELAVLALPEIAERAPEKGGDVVIGFGKLLERDAELARSLREGPFAQDARLPWRKASGRRPPASPIEAFAGSGVWTWTTPKDESRFLAMDGGETGHATWTFEPEDTGSYALYAWIPSREDLATHASFKIASAGSSRTVGIATGDAQNRGWVFLGDTRLEAGKPIEVARLDAEEVDATKITVAGPLLALRSRRAKPR